MKHLFTFVLVFLSISLAYSQNFNVEKLSDFQDNNGLNDIKSTFVIKNNTSEPLEIKWEKFDITMPQGWKSNICDPFLCFLPSVTSKTFTIAGNGTGTFSISVKVTDSTSQAKVDIKFSDVGGSEEYTGNYTFGGVVNNENLSQESLSLFPNPASNYFTIENSKDVANIEIINILGSKVLTMSGNTANYVDISHLNTGLYFVRLSDKQGRILSTARLQKN